MTCPVLRRLMSKNRTTVDDAERLSHLAKIWSIAASSNASTPAGGSTVGIANQLAPQIAWRQRGPDYLAAYHSPELAYLGLHLRGLAAQHFEDQPGIIG